MSTYDFSEVFARLYAITCTGYGLTPSVVGVPSGYPITAGTFRRSVAPLDLQEQEPPSAAYDRAVRFDIPELVQAPTAQARDAVVLYDLPVQLKVGYLWGADQNGALLWPQSLDAAARTTALNYPDVRAHGDALQLSQALREPTLYTGTFNSGAIELFGLLQTSGGAFRQTSTGRAVHLTEYTLKLAIRQQ